MYALNGSFLPIICINLGMFLGVTAYNFQIKLHFFLCGSLFHTCSKQCRPWWNASFRLGLHCLPDGTHLCPNSRNGSSIIINSSIIFFEEKIVCSYKAVVAGPAGRRAPDHFFGRVCFPPCPFFSFQLILLFTLILFNLPKFIDAIINNICCACHQ